MSQEYFIEQDSMSDAGSVEYDFDERFATNYVIDPTLVELKETIEDEQETFESLVKDLRNLSIDYQNEISKYEPIVSNVENEEYNLMRDDIVEITSLRNDINEYQSDLDFIQNLMVTVREIYSFLLRDMNYDIGYIMNSFNFRRYSQIRQSFDEHLYELENVINLLIVDEHLEYVIKEVNDESIRILSKLLNYGLQYRELFARAVESQRNMNYSSSRAMVGSLSRNLR